jgi:hypothetical protein
MAIAIVPVLIRNGWFFKKGNQMNQLLGKIIKKNLILTLTLLVFLPVKSFAANPEPECDGTVSGFINFRAFQQIIDDTKDSDKDGIVRVCLQPSSFISYGGASDQPFIAIVKDNLEIAGTNSSYIMDSSFRSRSKILSLSQAKNFKLKGVVLVNYSSFSSAIEVREQSTISEISGSGIYSMGSNSIGISIFGVPDKSSKIDLIKDTNFIQYAINGNGMAIGISSTFAKINSISNSRFLNLGASDQAMQFNNSIIGEVDRVNVASRGSGIVNYGSAIHVIKNTKIISDNTSIWAASGGTPSDIASIGSIENVELTLTGTAIGLALTEQGTVLDNARNFMIHGQGEGTLAGNFNHSSVGSIDSLIIDGNGRGLILNNNASIRTLSKYSIVGRTDGTTTGALTLNSSKIDLMNNGSVIDRGVGAPIVLDATSSIREKADTFEINR